MRRWRLSPASVCSPFAKRSTQPAFYTYEARFVPDDPAGDALSQNNQATAFTHVAGKGQVLLIENWENAGQFDYLVERLRNEGLEVVVQPSNQLFTSLAELQEYDTVILADVPRSSGEDADSVSSFTDEQIRMLVRNTEELGCGLIMMGGPEQLRRRRLGQHRFGKGHAGRLPDQERESRAGRGAGAQHARRRNPARPTIGRKSIAQEAIKALGPRDYCGLISWNGTDQWLWGQAQGGMVRVGT